MQRTLNIGILAHVDAGKTSLTEQILFRVGVTREIGSVDQGTTQTDTLDLERQRGITIQSAIVSFIGGLKVNLVDTPGHPDFIAEVERALGVLDGAVLVVSTVEGVQAQTRRLAQAISSARLPFVIFANKIDRVGAREQELLIELRQRLGLRVIQLNEVTSIGSLESSVVSRSAENPAHAELMVDLLTEANDELLMAYLRGGEGLDAHALDAELVSQVHRLLAVPVVFGSAMTGAGVNQLLDVVKRYLPAMSGSPDDSLAATVFKVQRVRSGERLVFARLFSGRLEPRQKVRVIARSTDGRLTESSARITGIEVPEHGQSVPVASAEAGDIVRLHGLKATRIGDFLGHPPAGRPKASFAPPVLESVVRSRDANSRSRLNAALSDLTDQDPLITIRRDNRRGTVSVRLYGEIQKEVIAATLAEQFDVEVDFEPSRIMHVERPLGIGASTEVIFTPDNPFAAAVGLQVAPGEPGSGVTFVRERGSLPLSFYAAIEETVTSTLEEGLYGWPVIECRVTLTDVAFDSVISTAGDFRKLTPMVLMKALRCAGTSVLEPVQRFSLEIPETCLGEVLAAIGASRGVAEQQAPVGSRWRIAARMRTTEVYAFGRRLPDVSRGEGDFASWFDSYAVVTGSPPRRPRTDFDPLNSEELSCNDQPVMSRCRPVARQR
jgi:ribosomal protection tetracycline resistance protein